MDKPSQTIRWFLLAAAIAAAVYAATKGFTPVQFTANDPATIGNQLLTLIFIALVIERAVEVFVNNLYGADELVVRRPLRVQQADGDMLDEAVLKRASMPVV